MMKLVLASLSAIGLLFLAACDGGDAPPPAGGGMEQPMDTTPDTTQPVQ